jgi:predicted acyl esterase
MNGTTIGRGNPIRMALTLLVLALFVQGAPRAQTLPPKLTVMVPMRDGTLLATDVYLPTSAGPWPVAFVRTPWDKNGSYPRSAFNRNGIVLVAQDVRGRFASQGQARPWVNDGWGEHPDGADTVAWIRQQSWFNGKLAGFGHSYDGVAQLLLAGAGVEGLLGQHVDVAPISPYHYLAFQSGVFHTGDIETLLKVTNWPPEALPLLRQHPSYDDYWRTVDLNTRLDQVRWPIVHVGGWFDIFTQGTIDAFTQLQEHGGEGARGHQHLVIGPWTHGVYTREAGSFIFPANAASPPGDLGALQWLTFWLTGQPAAAAAEPAVRYYVMGAVKEPQAPGNFWRAAESWPPPSRPLRLYFTAVGGLDPQPPATAMTREYDYDPANPVPTRGGKVILLPNPGPRDQRAVEMRPDVLVFSTPPLTEPLEVTGRISVRLYAATSAKDTDFTAKLTDVYPDGRSMLLTDGIVRARYRLSLEKEVPITPGERTAYDIDLWSTSIVFNRGHQIRVAISSSNSPRFEPNSNTWPDRDALPVVAHQTITLGGPEASHIVLREVVGGGAP